MLSIHGTCAIPEEELSVSYARSSGPGGQNVNKVNSKVVLRWSPVRSSALPPGVRERFLKRFGSRLTTTGELVLSSQRFREQPKNALDCRDKLRQMILAVWSTPKVRRPTKPTRGSKERRLTEKRQRSQTKQRRRDVDE